MWIRTTTGNYVNSELVQKFTVSVSKLGGYNIAAQVINDVEFLAVFQNKEDARKYLDRMMKVVGGRVFEVDMEDWNYTGHKKDHKEIREGGS